MINDNQIINAVASIQNSLKRFEAFDREYLKWMKIINDKIASPEIPEGMTIETKMTKLNESKEKLELAMIELNKTRQKLEADLKDQGLGVLLETAKAMNDFGF